MHIKHIGNIIVIPSGELNTRRNKELVLNKNKRVRRINMKKYLKIKWHIKFEFVNRSYIVQYVRYQIRYNLILAKCWKRSIK